MLIVSLSKENLCFKKTRLFIWNSASALNFSSSKFACPLTFLKWSCNKIFADSIGSTALKSLSILSEEKIESGDWGLVSTTGISFSGGKDSFSSAKEFVDCFNLF